MREEERGAGVEVRRDLLVDGRLHLVREQERDELRSLHRFSGRRHRQAGPLGGRA